MSQTLSTEIKNESNDNEEKSTASLSLGTQSQQFQKEYLKDKVYLFYCPSMKTIAEEIREKSNGSIILGEIEWNEFNDGFPNLKINKAYNLRWVDVAFLADLSNPRNIFEQYAVMCSLPRYLAKSVKIFVGYFPTGTPSHYITISPTQKRVFMF